MTNVLKPKLFLSLAAAAAAMLAGALAVVQFGSSARAQAASPSHPAGHRQCSLATLKGIYDGNRSGFQVSGSPRGPLASAAVHVFDGRGHAHGISTQSLNGDISSGKFTATYTLKPDCTGTYTLTTSTGIVGHLDIYTSPSGSRLTYISTDPGVVATGLAVRNGG